MSASGKALRQLQDELTSINPFFMAGLNILMLAQGCADRKKTLPPGRFINNDGRCRVQVRYQD